MAKQVSPGVLALRKVVDDVYADAREAKKQTRVRLTRTASWSAGPAPSSPVSLLRPLTST